MIQATLNFIDSPRSNSFLHKTFFSDYFIQTYVIKMLFFTEKFTIFHAILYHQIARKFSMTKILFLFIITTTIKHCLFLI